MQTVQILSAFIRTSAKQELVYRANFFISTGQSVINLALSIAALSILFNQIQAIKGWDFSSTLVLLGVYTTVGGIRSLVLAPGLEALAGMGQEIITGTFDFYLLRPANILFITSFRYWRLFYLIDIFLGMVIVGAAIMFSPQPLGPYQWISFLSAITSAIIILYSLLVIFAALVFWNPGLFFTWVFDALFQLARYPVHIYPDWMQMFLTWVIPVGIITTLPAQALTQGLAWPTLIISSAASICLLGLAGILFNKGVRNYSSASS